MVFATIEKGGAPVMFTFISMQSPPSAMAHGLGLDRLGSLCSTPVSSDLLGPAPSPVGDRIAVSEMHWDGSAQRRNVDSVTSRVGYR